MQSRMSGFKFKSGATDGEFVAVAGEYKMPHRIDLIKQALKTEQIDLNTIESMFYNFQLPDCITSLTLKQIDEENALYVQFQQIRENPVSVRVFDLAA